MQNLINSLPIAGCLPLVQHCFAKSPNNMRTAKLQKEHNNTTDLAARGWCLRCAREHSLPVEPARQHGLALMKKLARHTCLDFDQKETNRLPMHATDVLFGPARGKMFGILSCFDQHGNRHILRAFSGQYNGLWHIGGWAEPLPDPQRFAQIGQQREQEIKKISKELENMDLDTRQSQLLKAKRRQISANLMRDIHGLYHLGNFRGEQLPLSLVFQGAGQPPSGTGDCCAPKLLQQAQKLGLQPESMAEFYWGRDNKAATRRHACFYPPCAERCQPILGFMLCGCLECSEPDIK